jgi:sulfide:quinone oxidoreductase
MPIRSTRRIARKEIQTAYKHNLEEIRAQSKEAVFRNLDTNEEVVMPFDMILRHPTHERT